MMMILATNNVTNSRLGVADLTERLIWEHYACYYYCIAVYCVPVSYSDIHSLSMISFSLTHLTVSVSVFV